MFEIYFLSVLALIWMTFAVIQDVRTREIANWLNFSLLVFALGFRFFYSLFSLEDFGFFYQGLIGFAIFFVLHNLFYYGRMFAGGDAKLLMSLGAIIPFSNSFFINVQFFFLFIFLILLVGSFYGLAGSAYFAIKFSKDFYKKFRELIVLKRKLMIFSLSFSILFLILGFFLSDFFWIGLLIFSFFYIYLFSESVDEACMIREVSSEDLTEGDWLYKDVKVGKKIVKASWNGLDKEELFLLKKAKKNVLLRYGIQFSPVFLISFIIYFLIWRFDLFYKFLEFFKGFFLVARYFFH